MILSKPKKTKKKFYDKWCYKISLQMIGAMAFRINSLENIKYWLDQKPIFKHIQEAIDNKEHILKLVEALDLYDKNQWKIRVERNQIDIYTNDNDIYSDISYKFFYLIKQRFEPSTDIPLMSNNIIKVNKLPHGRFQYKVYIKPHKLSKDRVSKKNYVDWLDSQAPRISISESVKNWFMVTEWNWDRRYIWVEDSATLLILKLRNSDVFGKVYEYQTYDK